MLESSSSPINSETPLSIASFERVLGVLFHPRPTFESIVARPSWLLPLLLFSVLSTTTVGIFNLRVGWHTYLERVISKNSSAQRRVDAFRPRLREEVLAHEANVLLVEAYAGAIVGLPVVTVIVAAVLLGAFGMLSETKINFSVSFAVVAFSWVPWILRELIALNMVLLKDPSSIGYPVLVPSNPAVFLPRGSPLWLVSLLGSLDIFSIWIIVLMAIGYCATNPKKISFSKARAIIVSVWALYVALKVGLSATLGLLIHSLG